MHKSLEERVLENFDEHAIDLINLFISEELNSDHIMSELELLKEEYKRNSSNDYALYGYSCNIEGASLSITQIKDRCAYIWKSHLFCEDNGLDFAQMQTYLKQQNEITDPDELLYWTFKYIAKYGYDNPYPFTLYKALLNGRFKRFYKGE